jgi:subtilisin family serine protease
MRYTHNAVKFTDLRSYEKNKRKPNVKAYYDDRNIIVFKDRKPVTPNKTKVSHTYQMGDIDYGVPVNKAIMRTSSMEDALAFCEKENIQVHKKYSSTGVLTVALPNHVPYNDFYNKAINSKIFYSVQQDYIVDVQTHGIDYSYSEQWQLPALRCQEAWDLIDAAPPAIDNIVCVMDWGCDTTHPDLAGKLVNNLNITVTTQAADNVYPYNSAPGRVGDNHGTPCTGQIVAIDNGINTTGVSPYYTKVSFVYIFSNFFGATYLNFIEGIQHAISQPQCVAVSCSFSIGTSAAGYAAMQDAVTDALLYGRGGNAATNTLGLGTLVLASAGNGPCPPQCAAPPNRNNMPASLDGVLSIAALAYNGGNYIKTVWSDWGNKLFCAAPGQQTPATDILGGDGSTFGGYTTNDTTLFGGTSSACPITAGVVALVAASNPGLSANGIKESIQQTCNKVGPYDYNALPGEPGKSLETGWGMVDAYAAVVYATTGNIDPGPGVTPNLRVVISAPGLANTGEDLTVTYTLSTNIVLPLAETMTVTIFYSTDAVFDVSDVVITSFSVTIPAGDSIHRGQYTFAFPNTLATGTYFIGVNATSIGGETYTLDNTAFQSILVFAPPSPPVGLNLAIEITGVFIDPTTALPLVRYRFQNVGADPVYNFRYRKGFVGRDNFEYEIIKTILSEEYLIFETLWNDIPPSPDWSTVPYRIEILNVNGGLPDDQGGDNISEGYIDPGIPSPNSTL